MRRLDENCLFIDFLFFGEKMQVFWYIAADVASDNTNYGETSLSVVTKMFQDQSVIKVRNNPGSSQESKEYYPEKHAGKIFL